MEGRELMHAAAGVTGDGVSSPAFEAAELATCPERRQAWLTFAVVGAGPTGLELAGQIAEIARDTLRREFRTIDPGEAVILLVEANNRVLTAYDPRLSDRAAAALRRLGVTPVLNTTVVQVDDRSISMTAKGGDVSEVRAQTIIWAAGVSASPLAAVLASASGAALDRAGRVTVRPDLTLPGFPEVFAIGDMVRVSGGASATLPIPGVASAAMQEGRHVARALRRRLAGRAAKPFAYRDKGSLATIGRKAAVAQIHRVRLSGFPAWLAWVIIHLHFLMGGLQNQFIVLVRWAVGFVTRGRSSRLIMAAGRPGPAAPQAGAAAEALGQPRGEPSHRSVSRSKIGFNWGPAGLPCSGGVGVLVDQVAQDRFSADRFAVDVEHGGAGSVAFVFGNYSWGHTDRKYMRRLLDFKLQAGDALHRQTSRKPDQLGFDDIPSKIWVNRLLQECPG
jgi:Pyridine nucleotide-disulphide oxidoreductase